MEKLVLAQGVDGPCAVMESLGGFGIPEGLEANKVVILCGVEDALVSPEAAEELARQLGGEAIRIPACGHSLLLEQPKKVQAIVGAALVS